MPRAFPVTASIVSVCLVVSGCSGSSNAPEDRGEQVRYAENGTFTIAVIDLDYGNMDPYRNGAQGYDTLAYDSLVKLRPDGEFVSGLAEEWETDATTATFTLRSDVTCSDGSALTASQVAEALNYIGDPANASPLYGTLIPTVPFTATGDDAGRTVQVVVEEPFGFLLRTFGLTPIMCPSGMADPESLESGSAGTGPYVLTDMVPGQTYTYTRREGYTWGPDGASTSEPGMPATVVLRVVGDETTAANLLASGELNFAKIGGPDRERLDAQGLDKIEWRSSGAWLWFNQLGGRPFADLRVRKALVQALDLDEVIRVSTGGTYGGAATGFLASEPKACTGDTVAGQLPEHDVQAAQDLLDQAGWIEGADGVRVKDGNPLTVDLHYLPSSSPFSQPTAELVAQRWEVLGAQVKLSADAPNTIGQVMFETSNYDVYVHGFFPTLPTQMVENVSGPVPPEGVNVAGIDNPEYDELAARAAALTLPEACTYWSRAEQALWRDLNPVPVSYRTQPWYLQNAEAQSNSYEFPIPTSIRMLG